MTSWNGTSAAKPARIIVGPWTRPAPRWRAWLAEAWREALATYAVMAQHRWGGWPWL
jgi:hypothetical protein